MAAGWGHIEIVNLLLNRGADPNILNGDGETALFQAVRCKRLVVLRMLIDRGSDVNIKKRKDKLP